MATPTIDKANEWLRNVKIKYYDDRTLDRDVLEEIDYCEKRAIELRKQLNMYVSFFIPEHHPFIRDHLAWEKRRIEFNEPMDGKNWRETYYITSLSPVGNMSHYLSDEEINHIDCRGLRYHEVKTVYERGEPITRTTGYSKNRLLSIKKI